ncbi:MarR family transcriptional regulator, partial [Streptomyces sp. SID12501]|nr:MarR family transcriptional regulator [Streptomyces sp. SID12501]
MRAATPDREEPAVTDAAPTDDVRWLTADQQEHWRAFR